MAKIVVIDDEHAIVLAFEKFLRSLGHQCFAASTAEDGIQLVRQQAPDVVFLDVKLPGMDGLSAIEKIRQACGRASIVVMTAHGTLDTAVRATRSGAFEYLTKPIDLAKMRAVVDKALGKLERSEAVERLRREELARFERSGLVGQSPAMQEVFRKVAMVCESDAAVLIQGESGTGKELIARAIHYHSKRAGYPFEAINCACVPENLLESELFGHEKGAFTGAQNQKIGKFEIADRGTVFLDEVSELPLPSQAKLLRFIEEKSFERLGGTQPIRVDVRIVSATNQRLEDRIGDGKFRQDLFFRLNVVPIEVPPLRERLEDLPLLVAYFLDRVSGKGITDAALEALRGYDWPGNVRELRNTIEQANIVAGGRVIDVAHLPRAVLRPRRPAAPSPDDRIGEITAELIASGALKRGEMFYQLEAKWEKALIERVLRMVEGNMVKASEMLGINRMTLRKKMREYGIAGTEPEA